MSEMKTQLLLLRGIVASAPKEDQDRIWAAYGALNITFQFHEEDAATIALGMLMLEKTDD